jgi:hypothetical protein
MNEDTKLALRLTRTYAKLHGERERLVKPPKYVTRLIPDRQAHEEAESDRQQRVREIDEALPHLAYVIQMLNPLVDLEQVKPIRPKALHRAEMPNGISGTAMDIVREAVEPLATYEIVDIMGEQFGLDLSSSRERQRYYNTINTAFARTFRDDLIEHPGHLPDNPGWRRLWSWRHRRPDEIG